MSRRHRDDGSVETPGVVYDAKTVSDLKALRIGEGGTPAKKLLVLTRRGTSVDSGIATRLGASDVEWGEATGQEDLIDAEAPNQLLPIDDIERVTAWISANAPAGSVAVRPPKRAGAAAVAEGPGGRQVVERPLALGSTGLFGIVTEVPGRVSGPTIVFLGVATEPHIGPARLWVELAREWAMLGMRSVRVDLSGVGESPSRPGEPEFVIRLPVAFDDVTEIAAAVSAEDPSDVVLVGLCSSAYQALESALEIHPAWSDRPQPRSHISATGDARRRKRRLRRRVALPRGAVIQQFHHEGPLSRLRKRFPNLGWKVRTILAMGKRPSVWIKQLIGSDVDLVLDMWGARGTALPTRERRIGRCRI